jgi:hypothetical protein
VSVARCIVKPLDMRITAHFRGAVYRETSGYADYGTFPWRGSSRNRRIARLRHVSVARFVAEPTDCTIAARFRGKNKHLRLLLPVLMVCMGYSCKMLTPARRSARSDARVCFLG